MIGKILQNYRVIAKLGEGGMGAVYLAEHLTISRKVAIKFLNPIFLQNEFIKKEFIHEAQILANLYHPNIVLFIDFGTYDNNFYFIMEFIDGISLDKIISYEKDFLDEKLIIRIFSDILNGLKFAHNNNIVHRDIKPSNIIISKNGISKLLDFGIAKIHNSQYEGMSGSVRIGTPYYMSPEQLIKRTNVDSRTDIYSLGITMYEVLTKTLPHKNVESDSLNEKMIAEANIPSPRIINPNIPEYLANIVLKATEKRPEDRFQSCEEFLVALKNKNFKYQRKISIFDINLKSREEITIVREKKVKSPNYKDIKPESDKKGLEEKKLIPNKIENPYKSKIYERPVPVKNENRQVATYIISLFSAILIIILVIFVINRLFIHEENSYDLKVANFDSNKIKKTNKIDSLEFNNDTNFTPNNETKSKLDNDKTYPQKKTLKSTKNQYSGDPQKSNNTNKKPKPRVRFE